MPGDMPADAGASYKPSGTHPTLCIRESGPPSSSGPGGTVAIEDMDSLVESDDPAEIAASLADRTAMGFSLLRIVGKGGMGEVWEGVQRRLRRVVAVKRLRMGTGAIPFTESNTHLRSFRGEALTAALLDHPNIVPVYDLGFDDEGWPLLAMKFVKGQNWDELLKRDFVEVSAEEHLARHVPILAQVAQAVAFAHSKGVIHRDLKPSQVMIGEFGEVLLMDWGLALMVGDPPTVDGEPPPPRTYPSIHSAGNPAGTPGYMAPEQTSTSPEGIGEWTDVYLLGGILYKLLTGLMPHDAPTSERAFALAAAGSYRPIEEAGAGRFLPHELVDLAREALDPEPARRIPAAKLFLDRVQDFLTGASRRRESAAITNDLSASPNLDHTTEYPELTEALAKLGQADRLWPDNPMVPVQRARLVERYARAALAHGDLTLARAQAAALSAGEVRTGLLAAVDSAQARLIRQRRLVRHLTVAAFALLAGIIAIGTVSSRRLGESAETLRRQLSVTEEARAAEVAARAQAQAEADYSTLLLANALVDQQRNEEAIALLERIPEGKRQWEWGLVLTRALSDLVTIPLEYLSYSPSRSLALGYRPSDGAIVVARAATGEVVSRLGSGYPGQAVVAWSGDERRVAYAARDSGTALVHETATGRPVAQADLGDAGVVRALDLSFDGSLLAIGASRGAVRVVAPGSDLPPRELPPHGTELDGVMFTSDPDKLVTVSRSEVRMESLSSGAVVASRRMKPSRDHRVESDPSRRYVAIGSWRAESCILDTQTGEFRELGVEVADFEFPRSAPIILAAARGELGLVRAWDLDTGAEVLSPAGVGRPDMQRRFLAPEVDQPVSLQLSHDERSLVMRFPFSYATFPFPSLGATERPRTTLPRTDFRIELMPDVPAAWISQPGGATRMRQLHRQYVGRAVNGRTPGMGLDPAYYTLIRRGRVESRDSETGRLICVAADGFNWYRGTRPSPDNSETIAFGRRDTKFTVEKSNRATSEVTATFQWEGDPYEFSGSPDATRIYFISADRKAFSLWSLADGTRVSELAAPAGAVFAAASYSPNSERIALGTEDGGLRILDGRTGALVLECAGAGARIRRLTWTPDGVGLAGALGDGRVACWDTSKGTLVQSMKMPGDAAFLLWFSRDGSMLLAQPEQGAGVLWDWKSGRVRAQLGLAGFVVDNVRFLPGGDRLAAWSGGECRVWDTQTGREVFSTDRDFGTISADGTRVMLRESDARWTLVDVIPWRTAELPGDATKTWRERVALWVRQRHRKWYVNSAVETLPEAMELLRVESWRRIGDPSDRTWSFLTDVCHDLSQRGMSPDARRLALNSLARLWRSRPGGRPFPDAEKIATAVQVFVRDSPSAAEEPPSRMFVGLWADRLARMTCPDNGGQLDESDLYTVDATGLVADLMDRRGDRIEAIRVGRQSAALRLVFGFGTEEAAARLARLGEHMPSPPDPSLVVPPTLVPDFVAERLATDSPHGTGDPESAWRAWRSALADYLEREASLVDWPAIEEAERSHPSLGDPIEPTLSFAQAFPRLEEDLQRCLFDGLTLAEKQEALGKHFDLLGGRDGR